jgi:hypothetical protein
MNKYMSLWSGDIKTKIYLWWGTKTLGAQTETELMAAIIGPSLGTVVGMLVISGCTT